MKERNKPVVIIQCGKLCDKVKTQWGGGAESVWVEQASSRGNVEDHFES